MRFGRAPSADRTPQNAPICPEPPLRDSAWPAFPDRGSAEAYFDPRRHPSDGVSHPEDRAFYARRLIQHGHRTSPITSLTLICQ